MALRSANDLQGVICGYYGEETELKRTTFQIQFINHHKQILKILLI